MYICMCVYIYTHTHTHTFFFLILFLTVYYKILNIPVLYGRSLLWDILLLCPFYRWAKWVSERLGNFSRIPELGPNLQFYYISMLLMSTLYHFPWDNSHSNEGIYIYKAAQRRPEFEQEGFFVFFVFPHFLNLIWQFQVHFKFTITGLSRDILMSIHQRAVWGRVCFWRQVCLLSTPAALPGGTELWSPPSFLLLSFCIVGFFILRCLEMPPVFRTLFFSN